MTEPLLYRPTVAEMVAFYAAWDNEHSEDGAMMLALDQAQRTGKTAFACYLAIARSL